MCSLRSNDEWHAEVRTLGDVQAQKIENELARLAGEDGVTTPYGLENQLTVLKSWMHDSDLQKVRKVRWGRHRAYVTGHYTQCCYSLVYFKRYKKSEVDREEVPAFQRRILRAVGQATNHLILPP